MNLLAILLAIAVGYLAYLIVRWLMLKSPTFSKDAEPVGAIVGVIVALWRLGVTL